MNPRRLEVTVGALLLAAAFVAASPRLPFALQLPAGAAVLVLPGFAWSRALLPADKTGAPERLLATLALAVANLIIISLAIYPTPSRLTAGSWSVGATASGLFALWVSMVRTDPRRAPRPWGNWPAPRRR